MRFASLLALVVVGAQLFGCAEGTNLGSPDGGRDGATTVPPGDTSTVGRDSATTTPDEGVVDSAGWGDTEPTPSTAPTYSPPPKTKPSGTYDDTVGSTCSSDIDCDNTGLGETLCANGVFTSGTLYTTPVCIGITCNPGDGTSIMQCDGINGVCLPNGTDGICLPMCEFDATSGYKPSGCKGKDACNAYGWTPPSSGKVTGVGYCFGGCWSDADCSSGERCQREEGICKKSITTYTKAIGTACAKGDTTCNCLYATSSGQGACSRFCKMGEAGWCPPGFTCDASLPKADSTGATLFTKAPATMAGNCLKNCTSDSECPNGYCEEMAGTGRKTCQVGTR